MKVEIGIARFELATCILQVEKVAQEKDHMKNDQTFPCCATIRLIRC